MKILIRAAVLTAALVSGAGCAVVPIDRATDNVAKRVDERVGAAPQWAPDTGEANAEAAPQFETPMTLSAALKLAFTRNPGIHRLYARLGSAHADLQEAARIANPTLSFAWLDPSNGGRDQTKQGISATFADLLLLSSRRRLSTAEFRRLELTVAADLVALAREVEATWYAHLGALQIAAMRDAVAQAAENEAALARRYYEAGNINRLQLDLQTAAAARARIDALRAQSNAAASRAGLARLLGLRADAAWQTIDRLPAPPEVPLPGDKLLPQALNQRLDLAAVRDEVSILEDSLGVTKNWRLLGSVEAGYESEREPDGSKLRGPKLIFELPLFNQGQGAVERAEARLLDARARRDALVRDVENEVSTGIERVTIARDITDRYRDSLVPSAASAVARRQERVNFMLDGVFELIRAKRDEYEAWQAYFESVRDYWIARTALRAAVGGSLPGDEEAGASTIGVDEIEHMDQGEQP